MLVYLSFMWYELKGSWFWYTRSYMSEGVYGLICVKDAKDYVSEGVYGLICVKDAKDYGV